MSNSQFKFNKIDEDENFVFLSVKLILLNDTFYIKYNPINFHLTNYLCKKAGYDEIFSLVHMQIISVKRKKLFIIHEIFQQTFLFVNYK